MSIVPERLIAALQELRACLRRANMPAWDDRLAAIERRIVEPATATEGLRELEQSFGGMGSLNDIYICPENRNVPPDRSPEAANAELDRLLDAVFREVKLIAAPRAARLLWRLCEWIYRYQPPPRIVKSFARRERSR